MKSIRVIMTTFTERLETEKSELDDKISKSNNFLTV